MVFAFRLSHKIGFCPEAELIKVETHLKKVGLKTSPLDIKKSWDIEDLMSSMRQDKKAFDGKMTFILARRIGDCFIENNVAEEVVRELILEIIAGK
jgi:3-dehydroquinate synthase